MKRLIAVVSLAAALGCSGTPFEDGGARQADLSKFVGVWRSVTPSFEFVTLNIFVTSQPGVVTARLALSGVALDATGRPDADSLVAATTAVGGGQAAGTLMVRALTDRTLSAELRPIGAASIQNLSFVRD